MRRVTTVLVLASFAAVSLALVGSRAAPPAVTPAHPSVTWFGGPMRGAALDFSTCVGTSCNTFPLTIDVPPGEWKRKDGGVAVRIEWPDANDELDLHVFDGKGNDVAASIELHTNVEQALIHAPAPGRYLVKVIALHALNVVYTGRAWIAHVDYKRGATQRSTMRFAPATFVDPQVWAAEPSIWAAPDGAVYTTAPWLITQATSMVWRSLDGARTFSIKPTNLAPGVVDPRMRPCSISAGGGDADIVTDRTGRLYFADLWVVNSTVAVSTDRGNTWTCNPLAASSPEQDRPWLAPAPTADGDGPGVDAYLAYRDFAVGGLVPYAGDVVKPMQLHLDVTRDGGKTWKAASTYARNRVGFAGPIFTAADGSLYHVYQFESSVWLARSTDEGRTVRLFRVSDRFGSPANYWVAGDVDRAGNLYVAWVDQGTWDVLLTVSHDRGEHWSRPVRISPPSSETATFPWVAAGKSGDVAVSWYGTPGDYSRPDAAPPGARWYAWVARSLNGTAASPRFQVARMSETPVRFGGLCTQGLGCTDRKMGDFFEIDIARDGAIVATYDDDARIQDTIDGLSPGPYVMVTRQISGLGMGRSAAAAVEPSGDAAPPDEMTPEEVAPLDLIALPQYQALKGGFRLGLRLSSVTDLTRALQATGSGIATDAYWLALWKTDDRIEYAGMHVDRNGRRSFFGGDAPKSIGRPDASTSFADKLASYPATFALRGRVDERTGQILIDVPLGMFHLRAGDLLHSLQAFSMTSLLDRRTFLQPLYVVDATPAQTVRIR